MTLPNPTPYSDMTLPELRTEHARWVMATRPGAAMADVEAAHACRDMAATWVARREREDMAIHGTAKFFVCQDCACVVEMVRPVRRDAPDLVCSACHGVLVACEVEAEVERKCA